MLKRTVVCQLLSINTAHNFFSQLIEIRNNVILGSCEINYNEQEKHGEKKKKKKKM